MSHLLYELLHTLDNMLVELKQKCKVNLLIKQGSKVNSMDKTQPMQLLNQTLCHIINLKSVFLLIYSSDKIQPNKCGSEHYSANKYTII